LGGLNTYCRTSQLQGKKEKFVNAHIDRGNGIFYLEEATFRGEGIHTSVVFTSMYCQCTKTICVYLVTYMGMTNV
jgi:hypothetical protein